MKKTFLALMLILASVVAVNAQSLTGKVWATTIVDADNHEMTLVLGFVDGGNCIMSIIAEEPINEEGMKMLMHMNFSMQGTYTLEGKLLNAKFDKDKASLDIDVDFPDLDENTKKMFKNMMVPELNKQKPGVMAQIMQDLPNLENMTVKELTEKTLILSDSVGKEQVFTAIE